MASLVTATPIAASSMENTGLTVVTLGPGEDASDTFALEVSLVNASNLDKVRKMGTCCTGKQNVQTCEKERTFAAKTFFFNP